MCCITHNIKWLTNNLYENRFLSVLKYTEETGLHNVNFFFSFTLQFHTLLQLGTGLLMQILIFHIGSIIGNTGIVFCTKATGLSVNKIKEALAYIHKCIHDRHTHI